MTLDELKGYEDDVANHRQLPKEALDELFAVVRATLEAPVEAEPVVVKKPRSKSAD